MTFFNLAVIVLIPLLIGVFPAWPYSRKWSYWPSAGVCAVLLCLVVYVVSLTV